MGVQKEILRSHLTFSLFLIVAESPKGILVLRLSGRI